MRTSVNSSFLAAQGVGVGSVGAPWAVVADDYRDVAALGMSLCTRGDRVACSPAVEGLFMDVVAQPRITSVPATTLGPDVDAEVGMYPAASLACVLRVNQWAAQTRRAREDGANHTRAEGGAGALPRRTGRALAAHYADLTKKLATVGWVYMLRRPVPAPRPYPFPKVPPARNIRSSSCR